MEISYLDSLNKTKTPWFKSRGFRILAIFLAITAVIAVVLFSEQIDRLLQFWGIKAAPKTLGLTASTNPPVGYFHFFDGIDPNDSFRIGTINNREVLMLNPTPQP